MAQSKPKGYIRGYSPFPRVSRQLLASLRSAMHHMGERACTLAGRCTSSGTVAGGNDRRKADQHQSASKAKRPRERPKDAESLEDFVPENREDGGIACQDMPDHVTELVAKLQALCGKKILDYFDYKGMTWVPFVGVLTTVSPRDVSAC